MNTEGRIDFNFLKVGVPLRGVLKEKLGGVCGLLAKTLALFMTKICNIPYPIYDLTITSKPFFRSAL